MKVDRLVLITKTDRYKIRFIAPGQSDSADDRIMMDRFNFEAISNFSILSPHMLSR